MFEQKVHKARAIMIQGQRFWGALALGLDPTPSNVPTMSTNGRALFYNPTWVEAAPIEEVMGLTAKMCMHLSLLHHTRRKGRDPKRWKRACDLSANPLVKAAGFHLPADALDDPAMHGKVAEEIYRIEEEQQPPDDGDESPNGKGAGAPSGASGDEEGDEGEEGPADPGGAGQVLDAENEQGEVPSPAEVSEIEGEMQLALAQALALSKAAGQGSAKNEQLVKTIMQATVDWVEELARFVKQVTKADYNWSRPQRRFVSQGLYLPSLHSEEVGDIVVAVDESVSTLPWRQRFAAELAPIIAELRPRRVWVLHIDTAVRHVDEIGQDEPFVLTTHCAGGTDFKPAFKWVADQGVEPACFIYLTDLEGNAPEHAPDYPVLWACTTSLPAPWGERIQLKH